jgi:hypothetical protein
VSSKDNDPKVAATLTEPVAEAMTSGELAMAGQSAQLPRLWSDDQLADMADVATLQAMVNANGVATADISDLGTGFIVLDREEKAQLVGVPFFILDWRWNPSTKSAGEFVSVVILTTDGRKFIVNDGSTGICQQMRTVESKLGGKGVVKVPKGFTRSDYKFKAVDPRTGESDDKDATTFYLSLSK